MPMIDGQYQAPCQTCKHRDTETVLEPCWSCISAAALIAPKYGDNTYTKYEPKEEHQCPTP